MKKFTRLAAVLLALAMVLSCMVGCGTEVKKSKKSGIVGTWEGTIKLGDTTDELDGTALADFEMGVEVEFTKDGEMTLSNDIDKADFKDAFKDYMNDLLEAEGATAEDYEEMTGQSIDDLIDEQIDEMLEEAEKEETRFYKYEDGKLFTREDEDDEWEEEANFELKGDKMTLSPDEDSSTEIVLTRK